MNRHNSEHFESNYLKYVSISLNRYPRHFYSQQWNVRKLKLSGTCRLISVCHRFDTRDARYFTISHRWQILGLITRGNTPEMGETIVFPSSSSSFPMEVNLYSLTLLCFRDSFLSDQTFRLKAIYSAKHEGNGLSLISNISLSHCCPCFLYSVISEWLNILTSYRRGPCPSVCVCVCLCVCLWKL